MLTLYRASAGSGKTFTLATEYIYLLLTGDEDEYAHTLAVTFTNKATAEMKGRILETLYGIAHNLREADSYVDALNRKLKDTPIPERELREKCGAALTRLLHDYSRFQVSTIDSFFQTVLRSLARELRLTAALRVDIEDKEIRQLAVQNFVDGLSTDSDAFPHVLRYIQTRLDDATQWNFTQELTDFARCLFTTEYLTRRKNTPAEIDAYDDRLTAMQTPFDDVLAALNRLECYLKDEMTDVKDISFYNNRVRPALRQIRKGDLNQKPPKVAVSAAGKNHGLSPEAVEAMAQRLNDLWVAYAEAEKPVRLARQQLNPLRLVTYIDREIHRLTTESGRFLLANTPILLSRLVTLTDTPFVMEKMGTRLRNIMIDEFQDTSRLQWTNFLSLLQTTQSTGGHDLVVGDVKQSIYRWRGGDWDILLHPECSMPGITTRPEPLDTNYRSQPRVVEFNNRFFPLAAAVLDQRSARDGDTTISDIYATCQQKYKPSLNPDAGYIRLRQQTDEPAKEWRTMVYDDLIAQVRRLHDERGVPYSQMALLMRTTRHLPDLVAHLTSKAREIPLVSDEAFRLEASTAVMAIVSAMKWIDQADPDKRTPWRAYLDHHHIPLNGLPHTTALPLYELAEHIYRLLHLEQLPHQEAYVYAFFDLLQEYLRQNPADLHSFLACWDADLHAKAIPAADIDGIRLLTIHKAKGLQRHTILIPEADWPIEIPTNDNDIYWALPDEEPFQGLGTLPIKKMKKELVGSIFDTFAADEFRRRRVDELNGLYVAFTRAEQNLLAWAQKAPGADSGATQATVIASVARQMAEAGQLENPAPGLYESGTPMGYTAKDKDKSQNRLAPDMELEPLPMHAATPRVTFLQSADARRFFEGETPDDTSAVNRRRGTLLHDLLARVRQASDLPHALRECTAEGLLSDPEEARLVGQLAQRVVSMPETQSWWDGTYQVYNECEIAYTDPQGQPQRRRTDRVMRAADHILVVDYKFAAPCQAHITQVRAYQQLLQQMYPTLPVRACLLYPLRGQIENV